ncbi:uncharacterized protein B0H18DRAFT_1016139 [Fomitopsis serialis]|uniref:uncharacterized protein n=1 Tax=Fomitopsis serialis TaxID=139415 RepID=UPI002008853D|nr:uncharacterized protein B0H18DRAFT_1016139 [Neoantrodia serialis]KAH9922916.1 hypothetical protein B0H18DRAFT_1016139 [Neoantrodia serialis]
MAIIARATSSGTASASASATSTTASGGSPHIAMSTVTGLILGVMCLFLLVVSYQLIPCFHRKPPPLPKYRTRVLVVPPSDRDRPAIRRIFDKILTFLKRCLPRRSSCPDDTQKPKPPRSFKLPSQNKPDKQHIREKFATQLRLNLHIPPAADVLSPRTPRTPRTPKDRRRYAVLDDSVFTERDKAYLAHMEKPPTAFLSPWSPREQDFPYASSPTPSRRVVFDYGPDTPPPPFSPPPAYVAGTPIRGGIGSPAVRSFLSLSPSTRSRRPSLPTEDPFADSRSRPSSLLSVDPFAAKSQLSSPTSPSFAYSPDDPFVDKQPSAFVEEDGGGGQTINLSEIVVMQPAPESEAAIPPIPAPAGNASSNVFVISDETDSLSNRSSISSTWSALTLEQPM